MSGLHVFPQTPTGAPMAKALCGLSRRGPHDSVGLAFARRHEHGGRQLCAECSTALHRATCSTCGITAATTELASWSIGYDDETGAEVAECEGCKAPDYSGHEVFTLKRPGQPDRLFYALTDQPTTDTDERE